MNTILARATVKRRLPSLPYQATTRATVNLDRDGVMTLLGIRLQFRVTNGPTGPVGPLWNTLARLIRRLEVVLNGQDTPIMIPGAHLASRATFEWGTRAFGMDSAIVLTANAATDYDIFLPLPFFLPKAQRPDDASLDLRRVDQAVVAVTWGDASDLFATPNGAAISNVSCTLEGHYLVNPAADEAFFVRTLDVIEQQNTASNSNLAVMQDRGSMFYRNWHIATLRNNVGVTNILTGDVRLYAGAMTYETREPQAVLAETLRHGALPVSEWPAADRFYRINRDHFGSLTTLINAAALSGDLYLGFGTTYTSGTEVISISREIVRGLRV